MKSVGIRIQPVRVWQKWLSREKMDEWEKEAGPKLSQRAIFSQSSSRKGVKCEIYPSSRKEEVVLKLKWGGRIVLLTPQKWWNPQQAPKSVLRIGSSLIIVNHLKSEESVTRKCPNREVIRIPQGMAFGSGRHSTTRMCLQELASAQNMSSLLDLGTGSGILSIAAARLGCPRIDAYDVDPSAIRIAKENSLLNLAKIRFKTAALEVIQNRNRYQWVVANLFSELLIHHARKIISWIDMNGFLILSGVKQNQASEVKRAYDKLHLTKERQARDWCCLVYQK